MAVPIDSASRAAGDPRPAARRAGTSKPRPLAARLKPVVFALALIPAVVYSWALWRAWMGDDTLLGAEPIEAYEHATGLWTIRFLLLTLAITPLRRATGWGWLARYRRPIGLFVFFYALLHLSAYLWVDYALEWRPIIDDIIEHFWVMFGMAAFLLLVPLAITSTKGWIKRMGGRRWNRLHRLIYVAAVFASVHFFLAVKKDYTEPVIYAVLFALLLAARGAEYLGARLSRRVGPARTTKD